MRQRNSEALDRLLEARQSLREPFRLTPDTTLYLARRHITIGGQHDFSVFAILQSGENKPSLWDLSPWAARALGWRYIPDSRGVRVPGGGMSPAAALASDLYRVLFGSDGGRLMFHFLEV